jgi:hypothetical protein
MERQGIPRSGMNVTTYITLDVNYGDLRQEVGGHTISPTNSIFSKGDIIEFKCNRGWATSVKGWYVFHVDNTNLRRLAQLPMYFEKGNQWTQDISITMHYDHDVIVVCEMT